MKYFQSLPVNNVYFQIHYFIISQQIKLSLPSVEESVHTLYITKVVMTNSKKQVTLKDFLNDLYSTLSTGVTNNIQTNAIPF